MTAKKRFIAGAVCPKCGAMDRIVMYKKDDKDYRECVACGFNDEMRFKPQARELDTRVNVTEQEKQDTQVVKILIPKD
ncbi:YheV family putative zinc ribbon protein [Marinagarivorans algicola]|uniref:YheV family putative zinc ribbon protein n=1 Tax=Marinagarivorans algicola TaxID=1513270 RepID=UPI0006B53545|nr:YheV family putative zinc ribbon protein [Marinagarivorans algicola]